jgi:fused signal recognition particle receptor
VPSSITTNWELIALCAVVALALVVGLVLLLRRKGPSDTTAADVAPSPAAPSARTDVEAQPRIELDTAAPVRREAGQPPALPHEEQARADVAGREQDVAAMRSGLAHTRGGFIAGIARLFGARPEIDPSLLEEIEQLLFSADLGVQTTERILGQLRERMKRNELKDEADVWACIRAQAEQILDIGAPPLRDSGSPAVMLMIGVNGVGKTTTIGKLASRYAAAGKKVLLAAGDTYRAAAVLQLEMWGKRVNAPVVRGPENSDPSSVIFEAVRRAREEKFDLVIADTAGRLHTKAPLMDELKKIERTIAKANDGRGPDEVFLVLDATTGQNALQQMKIFGEVMGVTGVVLTKLDGSAKGGIVLGVVDQYKVPIRFVGLGEKVEDLREFESRVFIEALFAKPTDTTLAA